MNYRLLALILPALFLIQCATQQVTYNDTNNAHISEEDINLIKKKALEHFINGTVAESKGEYSNAILEFQDALLLDPNAGIYYAIAKNYYYLHRIPLALKNAQKAIELDSIRKDYYDLLADIFISARQYDSAADALNKIIELDSSDIGAYYKLARIYEYSRPLKAISIYNKLTDLMGPDWTVLIRIAELYEKLGNLNEAANSILELLSLDPSNTSVQKLLIELHIRNKNYDDALSLIDEILELTPDDLDARERKAQILLEQDKWDAAGKEYSYILNQPDVSLDIKVRIGAAYFEQSFRDSLLLPVTKEMFETIDRDTTDWQVKMYLGAIALNEERDSTAIDYFHTVTELAPWNVQGWVRLGGLYFDNRKYDEAATVMYKAIEAFPNDFAVNLILGLALAQKDKHADAKPYLKKSVELNPADINALSAYGYTLSQLKESAESIKIIKQALQINPDNVNLLGTLGLIYNSLQMFEECDSAYQRALELDPENSVINNNFAYSLAERGIRLDEALVMAELAVEADPQNSSFLDTIGWVYYKLEDYEQAKYYLEKALEAGGERAVILDHLGDVVFKLGEKDKAIEFWQRAFDQDTSKHEIKTKIEKGEL